MSCNGLFHDDSCECTREAALRKLRSAENLIVELGLSGGRYKARIKELDAETVIYALGKIRLESERDRYKAALEKCEPIGAWLSAAMEDHKVCTEMKRDIQLYFEGIGPILDAREGLAGAAVSCRGFTGVRIADEKILCFIWGHAPPLMRIADGIGGMNRYYLRECPRCGANWWICTKK